MRPQLILVALFVAGFVTGYLTAVLSYNNTNMLSFPRVGPPDTSTKAPQAMPPATSTKAPQAMPPATSTAPPQTTPPATSTKAPQTMPPATSTAPPQTIPPATSMPVFVPEVSYRRIVTPRTIPPGKIPAAFLLHGGLTIGSDTAAHIMDCFPPKNAYVNYTVPYWSYRDFILKPNEEKYHWDIFIHMWTPSLEGELRQLYKPRRAIFECNDKYWPLFSRIHREQNFTVGQAIGQLSKYFSIGRVLRLALEEDITYRYYFVMRPGAFVWHTVNLDHYDPQNITTSNDHHFVMNRTSAIIFSEMFDSAEMGLEPAPHAWFVHFLERDHKIPIVLDPVLRATNGIEMFKYISFGDRGAAPGPCSPHAHGLVSPEKQCIPRDVMLRYGVPFDEAWYINWTKSHEEWRNCRKPGCKYGRWWEGMPVRTNGVGY